MNAQGVSARLARLALLLRSEQQSLFGVSVSTPDGWDIILILYVADADGRRLTVGETIHEVGGLLEATKRRIAFLSHAGIIIGDGAGELDDVITLAHEAVTKVEDLIERMRSAIGAI